MERNLGSEIAIIFGERLKRLYAQDQHGLPAQMVDTLERLRHAEQAAHAQSGSDTDADTQSAAR